MRIIIAFNFRGYIHEYFILFSMSYITTISSLIHATFLFLREKKEPLIVFFYYFSKVFHSLSRYTLDTCYLKFASILPNPQKYCIARLIRFLIFQRWNILHIDIVYQIHRIIIRKFLGKKSSIIEFSRGLRCSYFEDPQVVGRGRSRGCLSSAFSRLRGDSLGEA